MVFFCFWVLSLLEDIFKRLYMNCYYWADMFCCQFPPVTGFSKLSLLLLLVVVCFQRLRTFSVFFNRCQCIFGSLSRCTIQHLGILMKQTDTESGPCWMSSGVSKRILFFWQVSERLLLMVLTVLLGIFFMGLTRTSSWTIVVSHGQITEPLLFST